MLMEEEEEGGVLFLGRKTPSIYNRLTFVNTIAQVLHARGIAVKRYKLLSSLSSPPPKTANNRTQQPAQPTSII
jgi:hypothetical protein